MISAVVAGNIGKDAELRSAGSTSVCSFSVASSSKAKGEEVTTWVRCSLFGKRGEALVQYLTKGKSVCVSGGLTTREYEGKAYVELRVDDVKLMGGKESGGGGARTSGAKTEGKKTGGGYDSDYGGGDDDIPF
jgi:single-strand DNA-binding protein